jgi:hypothetical protein
MSATVTAEAHDGNRNTRQWTSSLDPPRENNISQNNLLTSNILANTVILEGSAQGRAPPKKCGETCIAAQIAAQIEYV